MYEALAEKILIWTICIGGCFHLATRQIKISRTTHNQLQQTKQHIICHSWEAAKKNLTALLHEKKLTTHKDPRDLKTCHNLPGNITLESEGQNGLWNYRYKRKVSSQANHRAYQTIFFAPLAVLLSLAEIVRSNLLLIKTSKVVMETYSHKESLEILFGDARPIKALARFDYQRKNEWLDILCTQEIVPLDSKSLKKCQQTY